jgi:hypothetical protein
MTGKTTAATGAMTAATGAMTGKTVAVAGPGCSGKRELITTLLFGSTYKRSVRTPKGYGHVRHLVDSVCCHLDRNRFLACPCRWPKGP